MSTAPDCFICGVPLRFRLGRSKKTGRPCVMVTCAKNPRHFHGFINDQGFVAQVVREAQR